MVTCAETYRPRQQTPPAGDKCFIAINIINVIYIHASTLELTLVSSFAPA
jgi:hypothetical protein